MELRFHLILQPGRDHGLRDPVRDGGNPENPGASAMRFRYFHRPHRGREIAARGHPVPDLIQIAPQILRELLYRAAIHSRRALIGLDLLPCPPYFPLRDLKRLS